MGYPPFCGSFPRPFVPRGTKRRLQDRTYHIHVVYKCALAGGKGRGARPLPLHPAPVFVFACAVLLRCVGGLGGGCNEKRPYRSRSVRFAYSNFSENVQCVRSAYGYVISAFAESKCLYFIVLKDNGTFLWI